MGSWAAWWSNNNKYNDKNNVCVKVGRELKKRENTTIMCHCNRLPSDLSVLSSKVCTSSGNRRPCTKLWATRLPSPFSHTRSCGNGFSVQLEWGPSFRYDSGGRCHIHLGLSCWLPDNDTPWWLGGSPSGCITWANRSLFGYTWSLLGAVGRRRRRRGSLILALRFLLLCGWSGAGHETVDCHCPSCHHVMTLIGFGFWRANWFNSCFLGFLNGSFGFYMGLRFNGGFKLNLHVCLFPAALRHTFNQLVL